MGGKERRTGNGERRLFLAAEPIQSFCGLTSDLCEFVTGDIKRKHLLLKAVQLVMSRISLH